MTANEKRVAADKKRKALEAAGWKRSDRAIGGEPIELWVRVKPLASFLERVPLKGGFSLRGAWLLYQRDLKQTAASKRADAPYLVSRETASAVLTILNDVVGAREIFEQDYLTEYPEAAQELEMLLWMAAYDWNMEGWTEENEKHAFYETKPWKRCQKKGPSADAIFAVGVAFKEPAKFKGGYAFSTLRWACEEVLKRFKG